MEDYSSKVDYKPKLTLYQKMIRGLVVNKLKKITMGCVVIKDTLNHHLIIGDATSPYSAKIIVKDMDFYKKIAFEGSIGAGESFALGYWETDNLQMLLEIFLMNRQVLESLEVGVASLILNLYRIKSIVSPNNKTNAKKYIHAHYDLGNKLFATFLDPRMCYSSAVYDKKNTTLQSASENKLNLICQRLEIKDGDTILEIGSGWGSFAFYVAEHFNIKITTITISQQQYEYCLEKHKTLNLKGQVEVMYCDYRDIKGKFDKIVSIEMIEAVGYKFYPEYMSVISRCLKDSGLAVIQAILIAGSNYDIAKNRIDFIQKYIFPGSCIPSVSALCNASDKTDLNLIAMHNITDSYVKTLNAWRDTFLSKESELIKLGLDKNFIHLWEFYFDYCAAGFNQNAIYCAHLTYAKPQHKSLN